MLSVSDIKIYNDLHTRVNVSNKLRIKQPTSAPKEALKSDTGYPQLNFEKSREILFYFASALNTNLEYE